MSKIPFITSVVLFVVLIFSGNFLYDSVKNYDKDCNPNYSGCVTAANCSTVSGTVRVLGEDVFNLGRDGDGRGCEPSKYSNRSTSLDIIRIVIFVVSVYTSYRFFHYVDGKINKRAHGEYRSNHINHKDSSVPDSSPLGTCPRCGKTLISRHGKYGSFIGCSGYPNCKFSKKSQ